MIIDEYSRTMWPEPVSYKIWLLYSHREYAGFSITSAIGDRTSWYTVIQTSWSRKMDKPIWVWYAEPALPWILQNEAVKKELLRFTWKRRFDQVLQELRSLPGGDACKYHNDNLGLPLYK